VWIVIWQFSFIFQLSVHMVTVINIFLPMYSVNPSYYCFMSFHTAWWFNTLPFSSHPSFYTLPYASLPLHDVSMQFFYVFFALEVSIILTFYVILLYVGSYFPPAFSPFACFVICMFWPPGVFSTILIFLDVITSAFNRINCFYHLYLFLNLILHFVYFGHQGALVLLWFSRCDQFCVGLQ